MDSTIIIDQSMVTSSSGTPQKIKSQLKFKPFTRSPHFSIASLLAFALFDGDNFFVRAEDGHQTTNVTIPYVSTMESQEEKWIFFSFSLLMSWSLLATATAVGFYAWKEDRLMLEYEQKGRQVAGKITNIVLLRKGSKVCSSSFIKGRPRKDAEKSDEKNGEISDATLQTSALVSLNDGVQYDSDTEYYVEINYGIELVENYTVKVKKWIRLHGDELPSSFSRKENSLVGTNVLLTPRSLLEAAKQEAFQLDSWSKNEKSPRRQNRSRSNNGNLNLLVLPGLPMSGHAQSAIKNARALRSRFITSTYVIFLAVVGVAVHFLAVDIAFQEKEDEIVSEVIESGFSSARQKPCLAAGSLILVVLIQICIAVRVLNGPILSMLEEEYLKRGEFATRCPESLDSSLYYLDKACRTMSSNSDIFLQVVSRNEGP